MAKEEAKTRKPEDGATDTETAQAKAVLRVAAAGGPRRRAGLSFDKQARDLTEDDLGADDQERETTLKLLLADPMLSVSPIAGSAGKD